MLELVRLGAQDERDKGFDCGDDDLNEFFFDDSRIACSELVSVTYTWNQAGTILGFFSVSNDSIKREVMSGSALRRVARRKRYSSLPAVKIGRLAVDKRFHGRGIGTDILSFVKGWFIDGNKTGCRFVVVDAYNNDKTTAFYLKNGFNFSLTSDKSDTTRLMFFDLMTVTPWQ